MATEWYCRIGEEELGPFSLQELAMMTQDGRLRPTSFVRNGADGSWVPAGSLPELHLAGRPAPPPLPSASYLPPQVPTSLHKPLWPWIVGVVASFSILGFLVLLGLVVTSKTTGVSDESSDSSVSEHARIQVMWRDGTPDLQAMVSELTSEQAAKLGIFAQQTGTDFYAAHVRITNTGDLPVRIFPQNIQIHLNDDSTSVTTSSDPRFLQQMLLQPRTYVEGLVMYQAETEAGASVRLGVGVLSYTDDTIEVTY